MIDKNEALETARCLTAYATAVATAMYQGLQLRKAARMLRKAVGMVACDACGGLGRAYVPNGTPCLACGGLGSIEPPRFTTRGSAVHDGGELYATCPSPDRALDLAKLLNGQPAVTRGTTAPPAAPPAAPRFCDWKDCGGIGTEHFPSGWYCWRHANKKREGIHGHV